MHWKNKRFFCNFIITAIEDAFFCCLFEFVFLDDVWLCAHSGIGWYLNVLYFTLFDLLEFKDWTFFAFVPRCRGFHENYYSIHQKWINPFPRRSRKWTGNDILYVRDQGQIINVMNDWSSLNIQCNNYQFISLELNTNCGCQKSKTTATV